VKTGQDLITSSSMEDAAAPRTVLVLGRLR
jgi:hypothetical protein